VASIFLKVASFNYRYGFIFTDQGKNYQVFGKGAAQSRLNPEIVLRHFLNACKVPVFSYLPCYILSQFKGSRLLSGERIFANAGKQFLIFLAIKENTRTISTCFDMFINTLLANASRDFTDCNPAKTSLSFLSDQFLKVCFLFLHRSFFHLSDQPFSLRSNKLVDILLKSNRIREFI